MSTGLSFTCGLRPLGRGLLGELKPDYWLELLGSRWHKEWGLPSKWLTQPAPVNQLKPQWGGEGKH